MKLKTAYRMGVDVALEKFGAAPAPPKHEKSLVQETAPEKHAATVEALQRGYRALGAHRTNDRFIRWLGPTILPSNKQILMPAGGAARRMGVGASPEAQRAINVMGGLHEGFERRALSDPRSVPEGFFGHRYPSVLLHENNMVAGVRGPGSAEARRAFQNMRAVNNEADVVSRAVSRVSGGRIPFVYGETKLPPALRERVLQELRSVG